MSNICGLKLLAAFAFSAFASGDLAIQQPTVYEFVINMKTAKALGISIPQVMLLRADRVVE